jgi:hypothetical protein
LTLPPDEIEDLVKKYDRDTKEIKKSLYTMCWYMRGSLTFEQAFQLDSESREVIQTIITDNLETTKKSGLPFF